MFCEKGIVANRSSIHLGTVRADIKSPLTHTCLLRNPEGRINILSLKSTDPQVQVSARSLMNGSHQMLTISCIGGEPGSYSGKVLIETDDPHQSSLEVHYSYLITATNDASP